jgi:hypothetical protein
MARLKGVSAQRLTLDELSLVEHLSFANAWRPPLYDFERSQARWQTWGDFLADWERVRDEALAARASGAQEWQGEVFAEKVRRYVAAHGFSVLGGLSYEEVREWRG